VKYNTALDYPHYYYIFSGAPVGKLISSRGISIWLAIIAAYCVEFETCQAIAFQIGCALHGVCVYWRRRLALYV